MYSQQKRGAKGAYDVLLMAEKIREIQWYSFGAG